MKKLFLAAGAALALLASCSKHTDEIADSTTGSVVKIAFVDETPQTRAFFGTTAAAESWEKQIGSLTLFVFDQNRTAVLQRNFSASEIAAKTATIPIPDATPGQTYSFYVLANNSNLGTVADLDDLLALSESEAASYNGTFDEVSTKAKRTQGFTMTGSATQAIAQAGQVTTVNISLKRLVAKIAIQAATDSKFASIYPGRVKITSAEVSSAAISRYYFYEQQKQAAAQTFTHTQTAKDLSGKYGNLFYVYGNESNSAPQTLKFNLEGIYDKDGDFGTTNDQLAVNYEFELRGDQGITINQNTYRRITVNITGLTGADASITITPADWEGPFSQDVNIGM